jgi:aryl-alcohol dehydrogenase-like predicted oxidoreductase
VAHALGLTRSQLALAWALRNRAVSSVITGATKVTQIEDNLQAASVPIPDDAAARIEEILA